MHFRKRKNWLQNSEEMAKLIVTHVIITIYSCFLVNVCLSDIIHLRTSKFYRSKDVPDEGLTANPTDLSKASLVECALRTMLHTERRFLFNRKTSRCIIEEENSFAFNTPFGYARFIHQDIRGMFLSLESPNCTKKLLIVTRAFMEM